MDAPAKPRTRDALDKKRRILAAATPLFARKGYTRTSVKEVADAAGVAASLVIRHFESKRGLFRAALIDALTHSAFGDASRADFGRRLAVEIVGGPERVISPSMIALSLDDDAARETAAEIARSHILEPTRDWLGGPAGFDRAMHVMILSLGLALFRRLFGGDLAFDVDAEPARTIAAAIQATVATRAPPD